ELERVTGESGEELLARLRRLGSPEWPPESRVVPVTTGELPADLAELRVEQRKEVFFRVLTPIVLAENARLREARGFVQRSAGRLDELSADEQRRLEALAAYYGVERDGEGFTERLLRRLDEVPVSLALAQAANESGWGTSRFTREGNNLFGEWTWTEEGLVPQQREAGKSHRVRIFPSLKASVRSYLHNLNTHRAYAGFRERRAAMRERGEPLDGAALAGGLKAYSERGSAYIEELRAMIRHNGLERLRGLRLAEAVPKGE
ncbi:glucosaminidase domain-containing protein, partial [Halorhodospira neutriphila]